MFLSFFCCCFTVFRHKNSVCSLMWVNLFFWTKKNGVKGLGLPRFDAENIFLGGDDWHSLTRQVGGTPLAR